MFDEKIVNTLAYTMCQLEHRMRHPTLDEYASEVERTWKRHIKEAQDLLETLAAKGLFLTEADNLVG
jgi:hypothetical protein